MKKNVWTKGVMVILMVMGCFTTAMAQQARPKFIYDLKDTSLTVFTLNEDGKTLTPKVMYEYQYNEEGEMTEKKAYRWNAFEAEWKPAYLMAFKSDFFMTRINYAEWNKTEQTFSRNPQESIYWTDGDNNLLAYQLK